MKSTREHYFNWFVKEYLCFKSPREPPPPGTLSSSGSKSSDVSDSSESAISFKEKQKTRSNHHYQRCRKCIFEFRKNTKITTRKHEPFLNLPPLGAFFSAFFRRQNSTLHAVQKRHEFQHSKLLHTDDHSTFEFYTVVFLKQGFTEWIRHTRCQLMIILARLFLRIKNVKKRVTYRIPCQQEIINQQIITNDNSKQKLLSIVWTTFVSVEKESPWKRGDQSLNNTISHLWKSK